MNDHDSAQTSASLTRRDALARVLKGGLVSLTGVSAVGNAAPMEVSESTEFVPENDYPFFGGELPEDLR